MGVGGVVWDLDGLDSSGFVLGRGGFGFGRTPTPHCPSLQQREHFLSLHGNWLALTRFCGAVLTAFAVGIGSPSLAFAVGMGSTSLAFVEGIDSPSLAFAEGMGSPHSLLQRELARPHSLPHAHAPFLVA